MAHCKNEEIEDLKPLLEEILSWEKIQEKGFGKLYLKGMGFLTGVRARFILSTVRTPSGEPSMGTRLEPRTC